MAVALRLSRGGSNKRPFYRIVAADVRSPRDGRYIERLGTYNPMKSKDHSERLTIKKERINALCFDASATLFLLVTYHEYYE